MPRKLSPYLFLLPAAIMTLVFTLYPIMNILYYSFFNYNPLRTAQNGFIGLGNYVELLTKDKVFWNALGVSLKWVFLTTSGQFVIGFVLALVLNTRFRGRGIARAALFAPWALSGVIIAILWSLIYNQNIGVLNDLLIKLGLGTERIAWVANPDTAFMAAVVAEIWAGIPFFAISILAQLQSVPLELYESCVVDGGGALSKFKHVTFPHVKSSIILNYLIRCVWEFNAVDLILNLTNGGPVRRTTTLGIYLTSQAIKSKNFGYGSAIGVITFLGLLVFSMVYLKCSRYEEIEE